MRHQLAMLSAFGAMGASQPFPPIYHIQGRQPESEECQAQRKATADVKQARRAASREENRRRSADGVNKRK